MKWLQWSKDPELLHTNIPNFYRLKVGPFTVWRDSLTFRLTKNVFWNVNFSWPGIGTDNILVGPPWGTMKRLEFTVWPLGHWLIGLDKASGAQKWTLKEGYRGERKYGRISWHPPQRIICKNKTGEVNRRGEMTEYCGGLRWHKCPYLFPG